MKNPITGSRVLSVPCPRCKQPEQEPCRRPNGGRTTDPCDARMELWNAQRRKLSAPKDFTPSNNNTTHHDPRIPKGK